MNIEELEEALDELFPGGFSIEANEQGELIIYTGLQKDDEGELSPFNSEEDEEYDPDNDPIEDDVDDED
jgi:hypothetical protein